MNTHTKQLSFFEQSEIEDIPREADNLGGERPETYKGMYAMHKYWSKKPHNLVARYIQRFSERGEIILDAFCGSGVTVTEGVRLGRRAIGIDINPTAVICTKMGLEHVDTKALKKSLDFLRHQVANEIDKLYYTECPKCGSPNAIATHTIWENDQPKEIWVMCEACKTSKGIKKPSENDRRSALVPPSVQVWYPTVELVENHRINAKSGTRICDLFTSRALASLSLLLEKIRQIEDEKTKAVMEFCFSATLPQASKMVFVIRRRGRANGSGGNGKAEVGSWVIGYWIPSEHFEIHVWRCFENRFRRILRGKQEVNQVIPSTIKECSSFDELNQTQQGYWVDQGTATSLSIPTESIDYIFTDPPHGNRIPYLELSLMWNAWLGLDFEWENEIVVSEAKSRKKDAKDYQDRLEIAFGELGRVLKPDKYISVAFNSLDDDTWLSLLNTLLAAGFEIAEVSPLEYSARSVVQDTRKNALKTDFVITCQKRTPKRIHKISFSHSQTQLEDSVQDYLSSRKNGAETYEILNHLLIGNIPNGIVFKVSRIMETLETIAFSTHGKWHLKLT
jgi:DNA modification methylase